MNEEKLNLIRVFCIRELVMASESDRKLTDRDFIDALRKLAADEDVDTDGDLASQSEIDAALATLEGEQWVYVYKHQYTRSRYIITPSGTAAWRSAAGASNTLSLYRALGNEWLIEALTNIYVENNPDEYEDDDDDDDDDDENGPDAPPAKSDAWEPLALDREDQSLIQAIDKLEELVIAVEKDNGYAANEPDERNFVVTSLRTGIKALREQSTIYRMQFEVLVWEPVQRVIKRFGPNAIGLLATAAKELIKEGLKHAAKSLWN